jgi:hypothetical protein
MSLILSTPTNPGQSSWAESGAVTGQAQPFIFQPSGVADANIYTTWDDLVVAYRDWAVNTDLPDFKGLKTAIIYFDDTYAAISIPNATTGDPTLILLPETSFANARVTAFNTPISDDDRILVTIQAATRWYLSGDDNAEITFASSGLSWVLENTASLLRPNPADAVAATKANLKLFSSQISTGGADLPDVPLWLNATGDSLTEVALEINSSNMISTFPNSRLVHLPAAATLSIVATGVSIVQNVLSSVGPIAADPYTVINGAVKFAQQSGLTLTDFNEIFGPAVSATVRPAPEMAVICQDQLALYGATNIPQIKQAFLFGFTTANPAINDTLSITDGTTTEEYTFVAAAGAAFEVTIGASKDLTLANLAVAINADSVLWEGAFVANPQTGAQACAIIRLLQEKEHYPDRAFGTIDAAADAFVGSFDDVDGSGTLRLSYSQADFIALEAADPEVNYAGFATVEPVLDGQTVIVIDSRTDGYYQALNPLGPASDGSWKLVAAPSDAPGAALTGAGTTLLTRQTRLVVVTLAGVEVRTLQLPTATAIPGALLSIVRTDAVGGATLTLDPVTGNIDGAATIPVAVSTGTIITCDGTNWWTVAIST